MTKYKEYWCDSCGLLCIDNIGYNQCPICGEHMYEARQEEENDTTYNEYDITHND